VDLSPLSDRKNGQNPAKTLEFGGWTYRVVKSPRPRDNVPWELIATPIGPNAQAWRKGDAAAPSLPPVSKHRFKFLGDRVKLESDPTSIPVVEMPQALWRRWVAPELQDVVGIHFHELVSDDLARILFTIHKVPPDNADGTPPTPGSYAGRAGTRIEATLLTPLTYSLDQTILVRVDPLEKEAVQGRAEHELGHAQGSQEVLLEVLRGPQDWNLEYCTGRHSRIAYYWKREIIDRQWQGYREGVAGIATMRTSVVLVPPTRWSMLLPIPPERVTQKQLDQFNDAIVHLTRAFAEVDHAAQRRYHALHGAYDHGPAKQAPPH
jgi:hypothetical protein